MKKETAPKNDITAKNRLISEYMGRPMAPQGRICKYHESWDWIMPVIQKISENFHVDISILNNSCTIRKKMHSEDVVYVGHIRNPLTLQVQLPISSDYSGPPIYVSEFPTLLETIYNAVVRFIEWQNEREK